MTPRIAPGDRIPQAMLGQIANGALRTIDLQAFLANTRSVIVGLPGAFTPVCTCQHVPDLVTNAARFRANGVRHIICVTPDNPWVLDAWIPHVDPSGALEFMSDGNLSLARALGVNVVDSARFLGEATARYLMLTDRGCVRKLNVEQGINDLACTRAQDIVFID